MARKKPEDVGPTAHLYVSLPAWQITAIKHGAWAERISMRDYVAQQVVPAWLVQNPDLIAAVKAAEVKKASKPAPKVPDIMERISEVEASEDLSDSESEVLSNM